jgi:sulfoxide reductase heme-binding subunit YedZ
LRAAFERFRALLAAVVNWRLFKPAVFIACAVPLASLSWDFWRLWTARDPGALGVDPTKEMLHQTGLAALAILLTTLSVTPFRRMFSINGIQRVRRMLGVWSFAYAAIHLSIYLVFDQLCLTDQGCQVNAIWQDILKRRFILVGQLGFACLLVLALTSTSGWVRRLKKNWTRLHRLAYVAGVAGVVHFIWIQKTDISEPLKWAFWLAALLAFRVFWAARKRRKQPLTA